ncbi:hypothetical protein EWM64_g8869, partial [Hericium alpestre]
LSDQGQVNIVDEKKPKTKAEKAQDSRNTKGDQKLVINGELCSDHKVYIKPGTKSIPEKQIFKGAIACLQQLKWERVQAMTNYNEGKALLEANHISIVTGLMKQLETKEAECDDLKQTVQETREEMTALKTALKKALKESSKHQ